VIEAGWPPALLSRIEDAGLNASAPPQQRWVDGWMVRYSPGKAQRARCINALSDGLLPLGERLSLCQAIYAQAGLRMLLRITPFSRPAKLDDWLSRQGFQRFGETTVMVRDLLATLPDDPVPKDSQFEDINSEAYAHIVGELRGTAIPERHAHAQRLALSPVAYRGVVLRDRDGSALACGQSAMEADMAGLYDVFTAASARGCGLSRWLCARLLNDARRQGAQRAYLQVEAQNHAARSLYRRLGFADAYRYHYRARPAARD
jgi:GNAT superfamily N-acetyltransferase